MGFFFPMGQLHLGPVQSSLDPEKPRNSHVNLIFGENLCPIPSRYANTLPFPIYQLRDVMFKQEFFKGTWHFLSLPRDSLKVILLLRLLCGVSVPLPILKGYSYIIAFSLLRQHPRSSFRRVIMMQEICQRKTQQEVFIITIILFTHALFYLILATALSGTYFPHFQKRKLRFRVVTSLTQVIELGLTANPVLFHHANHLPRTYRRQTLLSCFPLTRTYSSAACPQRFSLICLSDSLPHSRPQCDAGEESCTAF